jgi:ATP-dependent DNA helicase PIF1
MGLCNRCMGKQHTIEKQWIKNFNKSPLVDQATGRFNPLFAQHLFSGSANDDNKKYPSNYQLFYNSHYEYDRSYALDTALRFLFVLGIRLKKETVDAHLSMRPSDYHELLRKTFYLLRSLTRCDEKLDVTNPFAQNLGDIYFFLRVETGQAQLSIFDVDLPTLYNKGLQIPEGYGDDPVVMNLFSRLENSNDSFFITGKAGTGKSTFIHYFSQNTKKQVLKTSFTGIAAMNVGGVTVHSFFRLPIRAIIPNDPDIKVFDKDHPTRKMIEDFDTLIIDEVSMLRSDILEAIDFSLRNNGGNSGLPFGGKQIIFVGDIFQLPPVTNDHDEVEGFLFNEYFDGHYFFDSSAYAKLNPKFFEFSKSYRQKEDLEFVRLLDAVRECKVNAATLDQLNERFNPYYKPRPDEFVITLTTNNRIANDENQRRLREIDVQYYEFSGASSGAFDESRLPTHRNLLLKRYAQVIFTRNDISGKRRWVNGTIGKIEYIDRDMIEVKLSNGEVHSVEKETWEQRGYKYDREKRKVISEAKGTFTQYPLKLAWAITIHKSQGLTFDNVIIDLGSGAFVNGQLYTALSRCRRLRGITLRRRINSTDVIQDERLMEFYHRLKQ